MKKTIPMKYILPILTVALVSCGSPSDDQAANDTAMNTASVVETSTDMQASKSFYDFTVTSLSGEEFSFEQLRGKRVLIVNTASECGYTPQYEQLQDLYEQYGGEDFTIVGFPANNFGAQEPGTDSEIQEFCKKNYGVEFPMMSKISVKGDDMHPVYEWLTSSEMNGVSDGEVKWNFHKFTVDENGNWTAEYPSSVSPLDEKIIAFAQGE